MSTSFFVGVLFILGFLAAAAGAYFLTIAQTSVHEIEALILFLIAAVLISSVGIIEAIRTNKK